MKNIYKALLASTLSFAVAQSNAAVVVLNFEGIANSTAVGNFYNGGAGTNYGIQFSPATLALVDSDAGGTGNFANEPSANTIMFFLNANNAILNIAAGFDTGFSFFYTSSVAATVNVYSGLNATGTLLGSLNLNAQHTQNCSGDPSGTFCNWTAVGVNFSGIAQSIDFGGTASQVGFDDITFGTSRAGGENPVPLPATAGLLALGLLGLARRRGLTTD